jgi:hypothetical protein
MAAATAALMNGRTVLQRNIEYTFFRVFWDVVNEFRSYVCEHGVSIVSLHFVLKLCWINTLATKEIIWHKTKMNKIQCLLKTCLLT